MLSMALSVCTAFYRTAESDPQWTEVCGNGCKQWEMVKKVRYALNMVSILVTWALENAIETADSMKSRGYD